MIFEITFSQFYFLYHIITVDSNVICELQNTSLSCPTNHVMSIKTSNFGRTDTYTCRHSYNLDEMHNNTK